MKIRLTIGSPRGNRKKFAGYVNVNNPQINLSLSQVADVCNSEGEFIEELVRPISHESCHFFCYRFGPKDIIHKNMIPGSIYNRLPLERLAVLFEI